MKSGLFILAITFLLIFGCTQQQQNQNPSLNDEKDNPYVKPLTSPQINLEDFEFEFNSVGSATILTVLFQKDNITKITKNSDNVMEMDSKPISLNDFEELAIALEQNQFFELSQGEYGEFMQDNGPTIVLEGKKDGKEKVVSCQLNCPKPIKNITQKVQELYGEDIELH